MPPKKNVVELLRVSTSGQADEDRAGLPRQAEANRITISRHSLTVIRQYRLVDVSGAATLYAPEVQEMLSLIRSGQAQGIVTADFDRLLRPDDFRSLAILQDIKEAGALIYLPDQVIDLSTQAGFLMSGLQSVIAGNELVQIKKRMIGAKEEKRRQGKHPGNNLCLPLGVGYDRKAEAYFYTPEAERVRELFDLFHMEGVHNLYEIGRRTGFSPQTVKNLLCNELYIGWRHYKQKRSPERRLKDGGRRADRKKIVRAPDEVIRVKVINEPLVPETVFWEVQEVLAEKKQNFTSRRSEACELFLFKGMLRCGHCGAPMYTVPGGKAGPNKDYYYCRSLHASWRGKSEPCPAHYLRREVVEAMVIRFITENLADKEFVAQALEDALMVGQDIQHDRAREEIEAKLGKIEKKRKRAVALHLDGILEREDLDAALAEVASEKGRLESKLEAMMAVRPVPSPEDLDAWAGQTSKAFAAFIFWKKAEKRKFLALERPQFWLTADGITRFSLPDPSQKNKPQGQGFMAATSITSAG